jgi:hypothetical protein
MAFNAPQVNVLPEILNAFPVAQHTTLRKLVEHMMDVKSLVKTPHLLLRVSPSLVILLMALLVVLVVYVIPENVIFQTLVCKILRYSSPFI